MRYMVYGERKPFHIDRGVAGQALGGDLERIGGMLDRVQPGLYGAVSEAAPDGGGALPSSCLGVTVPSKYSFNAPSSNDRS